MLDRPKRIKRIAPERFEGQKSNDVKWSGEELQTLLDTVLQHGTSDPKLVADKLNGRSGKQLSSYLRHLRASYLQSSGEEATAIDHWVQAMFNLDRDDVGKQWGRSVATAAALRLTALDEQRRVSEEHCTDYSRVYTYLATLASNEVPPQPDKETSRQLLSLLHYMAALLSKVDMYDHQSWLYMAQQKLNNTQNNSEERCETTIGASSLVESLASSSFINPLDVPANLLSSPLSKMVGGTGGLHYSVDGDRPAGESGSGSETSVLKRSSGQSLSPGSRGGSCSGIAASEEAVEDGREESNRRAVRNQLCFTINVDGDCLVDPTILHRAAGYEEVTCNGADVFDQLFGINEERLDLCRNWRRSSNVQDDSDPAVV